MAEICCGLFSEKELTATNCTCTEPKSKVAKRKRMEIRKYIVSSSSPSVNDEPVQERQKHEGIETSSSVPQCSVKTVENSVSDVGEQSVIVENGEPDVKDVDNSGVSVMFPAPMKLPNPAVLKFGFSSIYGRQTEMEDAVTILPSFCGTFEDITKDLHYFGVYDGHGCSHVATRCRERLHELVKEELESCQPLLEWERAMERSFNRMDKEVIAWKATVSEAKCKCELQMPDCDAVGSTAVIAIVTPDKIIVANCGDSRAVLCRKGKPIPLSSDHKPDRPDELDRIEVAGGRVIYWDGPRVLGVLAMSRAIGDNYLKPYVICEPEVTIIDRTVEDECLILASDGLWDVVENDTACTVARMCLRGKSRERRRSCSHPNEKKGVPRQESLSDKACSEASTLLTKLALARHSTDNISVVVVDLTRNT